jgi:hypothetical protein
MTRHAWVRALDAQGDAPDSRSSSSCFESARATAASRSSVMRRVASSMRCAAASASSLLAVAAAASLLSCATRASAAARQGSECRAELRGRAGRRLPSPPRFKPSVRGTQPPPPTHARRTRTELLIALLQPRAVRLDRAVLRLQLAELPLQHEEHALRLLLLRGQPRYLLTAAREVARRHRAPLVAKAQELHTSGLLLPCCNAQNTDQNKAFLGRDTYISSTAHRQRVQR